MAAPNAEEEKLRPIKQRSSIDTFGSQEFYEKEFGKYGFREVSFEGRKDMLVMHHRRVVQEVETQEKELEKDISANYTKHVKNGLRNWVKGGKNGEWDWGIHLFPR